MQLWKEWDITPDCPRCGDFEHAQHIWKYPAPSLWERSVARLRAWITSSGTMPGVRNAICSYVQSWRLLPPQVIPSQRFLACGKLSMPRPVLVGKLSLKDVWLAIGWLFNTGTMYGLVPGDLVDGCR
jgi:hypothetical protein